MSGHSRQGVIVGAGIAGLTTALALAEKGFTVRILERSAALSEAGAGIQLSPNATRILDRLGVLNLLMPAAVKPDAVVIRDARSLRQLAYLPLGRAAGTRWGAPYLVVHRADLQSALLAAARQQPSIEITTGRTFRHATFEDGGVTLSVEQDGRIEEMPCGLVVGADGVWSTLRGAVIGHSGTRFSGHLAWRCTIAAESEAGAALKSIVDAGVVTTLLDPAVHLVCYPVRAGREFNLVAVTRGPEMAQEWDQAADHSLLEGAMARTAEPLRRLARAAGRWTAWPLHSVESSGRWSHPAGLVLAGDAAHAMTPYAAQGAAMAIEDAAVLASVLERSPDDPAAAFARYETLRRARVARVARRGAFNHFAWHAAGPVAMARNLVLRLRPPEKLAADMDWLYGWDAAAQR